MKSHIKRVHFNSFSLDLQTKKSEKPNPKKN